MGVFCLPRLFRLLAGQGSGQLSLGQNGQLAAGVLAACRQSAHRNEHAAAFRGLTTGQVHRGGDLSLRQQPLHIFGPHLAAAQHHDPVAGGQIVHDVGGGSFQRAAVGAQLLGGDLPQRFRRQQRPGGGQAFHLTYGEVRHARRQLVLCQCQHTELAAHGAAL